MVSDANNYKGRLLSTHSMEVLKLRTLAQRLKDAQDAQTYGLPAVVSAKAGPLAVPTGTNEQPPQQPLASRLGNWANRVNPPGTLGRAITDYIGDPAGTTLPGYDPQQAAIDLQNAPAWQSVMMGLPVGAPAGSIAGTAGKGVLTQAGATLGRAIETGGVSAGIPKAAETVAARARPLTPGRSTPRPLSNPVAIPGMPGEPARPLTKPGVSRPLSPGVSRPMTPRQLSEANQRLQVLGEQQAMAEVRLELLQSGQDMVVPPRTTKGGIGLWSPAKLKQLAIHEGLDYRKTDWWDSIDSKVVKELRTAKLGTRETAASLTRELRAIRTEAEQIRGNVQVGMGIGEKPAQGGLFENLRGEADKIPLADREQMAMRQARQAEIAAGQAEMPLTNPAASEAISPAAKGAGATEGVITEAQARAISNIDAPAGSLRWHKARQAIISPTAPVEAKAVSESGGQIAESSTAPSTGAPAYAEASAGKTAAAEPVVPPPGSAVPPTKPPIQPPVTTGAVPPGEPPQDPLKALTAFIKAAKPANEETAALVHATRQKQAAMLASAQGKAQGQQEVMRAQGLLKGELPTAQFEPPKNTLTQDQWDGLFNQLNQSPRLQPFQKVSAANALQDVQNGRVPVESDIALLEKVFGQEFANTLIEKGTTRAGKIINFALDILNISRSLQTGPDISAAGRQGSWFATTHPKEFGGAFKAQFQAIKSEEATQAIDVALRTGPEADVRATTPLYMAPFTGQLSTREEAIMSKLIGKLPGYKQSNRAYVTFLNKLRADTFDTIVASWKADGRKVTQTDLDELALYINRASGRGSLGPLNKEGKILSSIFYSPRFSTSRFQIAQSMLSKSTPVRQQAWRDFGLYVGPRVTALVLASAAGIATVEWNPQSTDFAKFKIGQVRIDPWGGWQPVVRYMAQGLTNKRKVLETGKVSPVGNDAYDGFISTLGRFGRSKLAPPFGEGVNVATGKNFVGQPMTLLGETKNLLEPLVLQDMNAVASDYGWGAGAAAGVVSATGVGIQDFAPKTPGSGASGNRLPARTAPRLPPRTNRLPPRAPTPVGATP